MGSQSGVSQPMTSDMSSEATERLKRCQWQREASSNPLKYYKIILTLTPVFTIDQINSNTAEHMNWSQY